MQRRRVALPEWRRGSRRDRQPLTPGRCSPWAGPHLPLPLPSSTLRVHKHQEGMCPGPGADLEGTKGGCEYPAAAGLSAHPQQSFPAAWHEPTCRPCPSTVVELNLKPWLSSGLVLAGESLSDLRQWDCLSFGEQRCGCARRPGKAAQGEAGWLW